MLPHSGPPVSRLDFLLSAPENKFSLISAVAGRLTPQAPCNNKTYSSPQFSLISLSFLF